MGSGLSVKQRIALPDKSKDVIKKTKFYIYFSEQHTSTMKIKFIESAITTTTAAKNGIESNSRD